MKTLIQKKSTRICVLAVILLIIVLGSSVFGSRIYNRQQVQKHLAMAQKYLLELDYEQAIVEYTLAISIDPKSQEIRDILETVYLDYAQSYIDKKEFDEAIEVLSRGYDQLQIELFQEEADEIERIKAEEEEKERVQKEQEAIRKQQQDSQKQADKVNDEEDRKRIEELKGIYKWEISTMDMMDFPIVVGNSIDTDNAFVFGVQFGMKEDMEMAEKHIVHIGKEDGKADVDGIEETYDLSITDEIKEEYAAYLENQKAFDVYAKVIADYVIDEYYSWNGDKVVLFYHPQYSRVTDCKLGPDLFEGKIVLSRDYYDPLYVTCLVDLTNHEAEIIDIDSRYPRNYDDESLLMSLVGQKIQL